MYPIIEENGKIIGFSVLAPLNYQGPEIPEDFDISQTEEYASFYESGKFVRKNIFNISDYKSKSLKQLSNQCYAEAEKILPQSKQINILTGGNAVSNYPGYLQGETGKTNVGKFIAIYQKIFHDAEIAINNEFITTKIQVDEIFNNIIFPTQEEILVQIQK